MVQSCGETDGRSLQSLWIQQRHRFKGERLCERIRLKGAMCMLSLTLLISRRALKLDGISTLTFSFLSIASLMCFYCYLLLYRSLHHVLLPICRPSMFLCICLWIQVPLQKNVSLVHGRTLHKSRWNTYILWQEQRFMCIFRILKKSAYIQNSSF